MPDSSTMKPKIVPIVVMLAAVTGVAGGWLYFRNQGISNDRVFVSGNIEATEVDLSFRIAGQIMRLDLEEGTRVKKNAPVAELDTDTLEAQRASAKAEIAGLRAALDELEEGTRKEQIAQAKAIYKAAESKLKNAKDEYDRYEPLFKEGAVSASTFDTRVTILKTATEDYNNAKERLLELERGPREEQIRAARARWEKAKWELKRIELDIEHSLLTSPVSGVVLIKANEIGEVVLPGATVATVAAIDEVWLKGYVGESYLGKIKYGQKAEITTDSYPGKVYVGTVTFISSRAEFTPKNVQTKQERVKQVYRVKITIPNPHEELKIGMPAEGYILIGGSAASEEKRGNGKKPSS